MSTLNKLINRNRKRKYVNDAIKRVQELREKGVKKKRKRRNQLWIMYLGGNIRAYAPKDSTWFKLHLDAPIFTNHIRKVFRRRFCVPHDSFIEPHDEMQDYNLFVQWS